MKAILFDLDGTLLPMDIEKFIYLYGKSVSEAFYDFTEVDRIFPQVMHSVKDTVMNTEKKKNFDKFFDHFEMHMPRAKEEYIKRFNEFYIEGFEKVKSATSSSAEIVEAVDILKSKGFKLIIATNPVFPMAANISRIRWAGLTIESFDYITSFEENHYCKPHLKFYKEVLEQNGLEAEDVLMVGNDVQEDLCIKSLGAKTYLLEDHIINRKPDEPIDTDFRGTYHDFLQFVKSL
ncbi:MAG: HAD family hydrolase [Clostridiales bacterium]|nr:HAD family hydrolase [Clostridiales bacterium]